MPRPRTRRLWRDLDDATGAWSESESNLDRFFLEGESARTAEEFLRVLTKWTQDVSGSLPLGARTLFQMLCILEDDDRQEQIVEQVWPDSWKALSLGEPAPSLEQALSLVKSAGLVDPSAQGELVKYVTHEEVAQAGLRQVDDKFRMAVDSMMASLWKAIFDEARSGGDNEKGQMVIMAGLRSAPYLMRRKNWSEASTLLEHAIIRDSSQETIASVLPLLRHLAMPPVKLIGNS